MAISRRCQLLNGSKGRLHIYLQLDKQQVCTVAAGTMNNVITEQNDLTKAHIEMW